MQSGELQLAADGRVKRVAFFSQFLFSQILDILRWSARRPLRICLQVQKPLCVIHPLHVQRKPITRCSITWKCLSKSEAFKQLLFFVNVGSALWQLQIRHERGFLVAWWTRACCGDPRCTSPSSPSKSYSNFFG